MDERGDEMERLARRVATLERSARRDRTLLAATVVLAALGIGAGSRTAVAEGPEVLRVRGLVVEDANGTERVWIGAPVPEPRILGKRLNRGGGMHGILLFDEEGNERSGYVTSDGYPNVLFTLDSLASQQVLFITEPQGGTTLRMWGLNDHRVDLHVGDDGAGIQVIEGGEVTFSTTPEAAEGEDR